MKTEPQGAQGSGSRPSEGTFPAASRTIASSVGSSSGGTNAAEESAETNSPELPRSELIVMGTGTSVGVPVVGCHCSVCRSANPRNQRTRSGVLIRAPQGEFVIDTGPELRLQLVRNEASLIQAAIFTHAHADHIMGLDDLRIFGYRLNAPIPLYCEAPVEQQIRQCFSYAFTDPSGHAHQFAAPKLEFRTIVPGTEFELLGLNILPLRLKHGELPVLGFRIGNVAFCTDVTTIPLESRELLRDLDVLVLDALRYDPHPTHLCVSGAVRLIQDLKPKSAYLTHMSHELDYDTLKNELPEGIEPAWDGLSVSLT
ncbi:MAG: MBL fold metallo-hydrolase [Planctomyces sp.]|jgi:phosphoribosyl 1,2-cyclic phosphate phosphodiesterase